MQPHVFVRLHVCAKDFVFLLHSLPFSRSLMQRIPFSFSAAAVADVCACVSALSFRGLHAPSSQSPFSSPPPSSELGMAER